jgi:hypothetical protein
MLLITRRLWFHATKNRADSRRLLPISRSSS